MTRRVVDDAGRVWFTKVPTDERSTLAVIREREVLGQLRHPNVVESAPTAGDELLTAGAGDADLAAAPPATVADAVRTLGQLSRIVAELHEMGWAHGALRAEHVIRTPHAGVVLCSWRRASRVERPDSPPALADVRSLVEMGRTWHTSDSANLHDRALARRFARTLDATDATTTAESLAARLARLAEHTPRGVTPQSRPRRPRRVVRPVRPHRGRHRRKHSPTAGLVLRTMICAAASVWLASSGVSDRVTAGSASTTLPFHLLVWTTVALGAYGVLLNGLALIATLSGSTTADRWSRQVGPTWLRRWVTGLAAVGVAGSAIASPQHQSSTPPLVVSNHHPERRAQTSASTTTPPTTTTTPPTTTTAPPVTPAISSPASVAAPPSDTPPLTYTLHHGDHLWSVAERAVSMALRRTPTTHEVTSYWRRLVRVNRHVLVAPDAPDLVFAGQVVELPALE